MKICYVGWGDHVHVERWANYFAERGHSVSVISFSSRGRYSSKVKQYRIGIEKRAMRWRQKVLQYLLWWIKPELVHVHWAHFAPPVANVWNGPLVVTAWGSDIYRLPDKLKASRSELIAALKKAAVITCDSWDLEKEIKNIVGGTSVAVEVIQWGVDTSIFRLNGTVSELSRELDMVERKVIYSARNFTPTYNQETVVRAFAIVRKSMPDAVLLMKNYDGDDDYLDSIKSEIASCGLSEHVKIVDKVPYEQMPDLYRMAKVTVSVPFSDATPMSVLEAMACGSVPVVSDLPSLHEWIEDDVNGYIVPVTDYEQLAQRILKVFRNPDNTKAMVKRNIAIVQKRADHDTNMRKMAEIYSCLA